MRSFELLDHTADVGLRARGGSLAELLAACAEGMFSVVVEEGEVREETAVKVELEASDAEALVHAWLRELLFRFSADGLVFARFDVQEATASRLRAVCHGEAFDPGRHRGGTEIKAVTWHDFKVEEREDGWLAEALLDI
jgi:SHS2 domain-containing protein